MRAHAGEKTRTDCTFVCQDCQMRFAVQEKEPVPKCYGCGSDTFEMLTGELEQPGAEHAELEKKNN
ncbi:MAG: alpha helical protein [Deltaproteobacteria bacterium]